VAQFEFSANNLGLSLKNPSFGEAEDSLPIEYSGDDLTTGFNVNFLLQSLGAMRSEKVKLSFTDTKKSFLLTGDEDPGYVGVLMTSS
jgi:DNA polymerase-3 subunit beta